jgi:hypothetical protein
MDWQQLRFGVEIEFVGGAPERLPLLPGWTIALDELQTDDFGRPSGAELKPGPLTWAERDQIRIMLDRLQAMGARANWSCGLHVHVGLEPWGEAILLPLMEAALQTQEAFYDLLQTAPHRRLYCPPVLPELRDALKVRPSRESVRRTGNPASNRCGINLSTWWDIGTVEFRFANGSVQFDAICRTVELYLRFVAAVGAGVCLPAEAGAPAGSLSGLALANALGAPPSGYPAPQECPPWRWEQLHLDALLRPVLAPLVAERCPAGEILSITPTARGLQVTVELPEDQKRYLTALTVPGGWRLVD